MRSIVVFALTFLFLACGSDAPEYPAPPRDAGLECGPLGDGGEAVVCSGDRVCVQGRCYEPCSSNAECAGSEVCNDDGVCVQGRRPDAGMPDAGLCPGGCSGDTPVCHPAGVCTACVEGAGECGAAAPICDLAYGVCSAFVEGRICAPCNSSADCDGGRTCTERGGERVCLSPCAEGMCPRGFACGADDLCVPGFGTCTGVRNGVTAWPCAVDADCEPLGASPPPGVCQGASEGVPGVCIQACEAETDCLAGTSCVAGYCRPT